MNEMTKEELRIRVAELLGWTQKKVPGLSGLLWQPAGTYLAKHMTVECPDYAESLDAMREAVASLSEERRHSYAVVLALSLWPNGWADWRDTLAVSEATAEQRASAFVKTIEGSK